MSSAEIPPSAALGSEDARDAVAAIVEKADERQKARADVEATQEESGPKKPLLARPAVAAALMAVFVGILGFDVYLLTRPVEAPTPAEMESSARMETAVVALQIEAYKQEHGRYPTSLGEAGVQLQGVDYTKTAEGYVLQGKVASNVTLRADQDPEALVRAVPPLGGTP